MHRELGSFETALTLTGRHAPFVVVVVLHLDPGPARQRLRDALDRLQRRHALLGVRIAERDGRLWYEPAEGVEIPLHWAEADSPDRWREVAEEELNLRIDETAGPLLRATYLASPASSSGELILTFHHAALDGASGGVLLQQLLDLCGGGEIEAATGAGAPAGPPALETLLPPSFRGVGRRWRLLRFLARQIGDEMAYRFRLRGGRRPPVVEPTRCRILPVELPADATEALVDRSRRERVTIPSAVSAAFLLAVFRHLYPGRRQPLRTILFADLRPYLHPPLGEEPLGSYISMLRYTLGMEPGQEFWPLARRITGQLAESLHRGDKFASALLCEKMMRMALGQRSDRMATTAISYSGVVRLGNDRGAIGLRDLHTFVSNFGLGPEYTAQVKMFRGRLLLDIVYLDADMDRELAAAIAGEIVGILRQAAVPQEPRREHEQEDGPVAARTQVRGEGDA